MNTFFVAAKEVKVTNKFQKLPYNFKRKITKIGSNIIKNRHVHFGYGAVESKTL